MPTVIPVKFKYAARDLWFDPAGTGAQEADHVICSTERGTEIGLATADTREVDDEELKSVIGEAPLRQVVRIATESDLARAEVLAEEGEQALPIFKRLVHEAELDMKPVGVEYLFGGDKVVCYFSADERVDFRQLVRDLSRTFHERVDMRQIGVREEAAIVGGFGHCGQELCCARFGRQFEPVSIRMAKEQDLPLNSSKISGACGRLMCCLRYEFEAYRDFKGRAPKRNAVIETPLGKAKIVEYDTPKEQICLRLENGKQIRVPLADMVASPAAKKKSEDLGCPCRPDTVTRDALERLQSPDVQMALAELDRKMGKVPEESFDESDIFVEQKPKRHRSHQEARGAEDHSGQEAPRVTAEKTTQDEQPHRRRRKTVGPQTPQTNASSAGNGPSAAGTGSEVPQHRRRRRHHSAPDAASIQKKAAGMEWREHSTSPGKTHQSDEGPRRRRPGDHGGARGGQAGFQDAGTTPRAEKERPRRRRRHRGGRGYGSGEGQEG